MRFLRGLGILSLVLCLSNPGAAAPALEAGFANPPPEARLRAIWWWLNGNVTRQAITRDLEEMHAKGFGGFLLMDADGSGRSGNERVPHGPAFLSPEWRELYCHALAEARRFGLEVSLSPQSGYNLGGPMVKVADAVKKIVWTETGVAGGPKTTYLLPEPAHTNPWYQDLFLVAYRVNENSLPAPLLQNWEEKTVINIVRQSAPDTARIVLEDVPARPGEEDTYTRDMVNLTGQLNAAGELTCQLPVGVWRIVRLGCTTADRHEVSMVSHGWEGYALDVLDEGAFRRYWQAAVEPLVAEAGAHVGTTLKYLVTDSWEVDAINWTPSLPEEFRRRRGYDLWPYVPVLAGRIVNSRDESNRFLGDFRKTLGDLAVDHYYRPFAELAHQRGLDIHPEAGGPHAVPIDAQRCLSMVDIPMGEFWARGWLRRVEAKNRFFVKQPASAAHTSGRPLAGGEGFTTIGLHWQETIWDNLKPAFDRAACEGMNRLFWHAFVCSPDEMGLPGQQYFAGTHLNPNVTWWPQSAPFFTYLNRVQFMLQRGMPVADVLYYYGDHVPNFTQLRDADPARVGPGFDYDVIDEHALLERVGVQDGRLVLPDGMSYRLLVLPDHAAISLPVLRKVRQLIAAGALVSGRAPVGASGLDGSRKNDAEVKTIAAGLWGEAGVVADRPAREILRERGLKPDFEYAGAKGGMIDYIHRREGTTEIYFVSSRSGTAAAVECSFRVGGRSPEIWDAVTGERTFAPAYDERDGRTTIPLEFEPFGSRFIVFRSPAPATPVRGRTKVAATAQVLRLAGPWQVHFDRKWGGPGVVELADLTDWTVNPHDGIRFYSGTASYQNTFDLPVSLAPGKKLMLDLGQVRELAEVSLNGKPLGVVWTPPFRVNITEAVLPAGNRLEIKVVNFWPNRIIGDQSLPPGQRFTRTNVRELTKHTPLMPSGLLGPVSVLSIEDPKP